MRDACEEKDGERMREQAPLAKAPAGPVSGLGKIPSGRDCGSGARPRLKAIRTVMRAD